MRVFVSALQAAEYLRFTPSTTLLAETQEFT